MQSGEYETIQIDFQEIVQREREREVGKRRRYIYKEGEEEGEKMWKVGCT
jgi:hypothetical protein